jgi:predicted glutamine amidotransferase
MCKLAGWTSSKDHPLTRANADLALRAAHAVIAKTERDGFGYAQASSSGLRGKYVRPSEFKSLDGLPNMYQRAGKAAEAFSTTFRTSHEGSYKPDKHMIVHGRTATCGISLENVHPFRRNGWTLAHNGVIGYSGSDPSKAHSKVTCDSQHLLICMADNTPTLKRKEDLKDITGYAAFLALNPQGKLFVAVDDTARLYAGITKTGRWIFGTTEQIVEAISDVWKCKGVEAYPINEWTWLEFDQANHSEPELSEWSHKKASQRQLGFASQSLGSSWDHSTYRKKKVNSHGFGHGTYSPSQWLSAREAEEQKELITEADAIASIEAAEADLDGIPSWEPSH